MQHLAKKLVQHLATCNTVWFISILLLLIIVGQDNPPQPKTCTSTYVTINLGGSRSAGADRWRCSKNNNVSRKPCLDQSDRGVAQVYLQGGVAIRASRQCFGARLSTYRESGSRDRSFLALRARRAAEEILKKS